MNKYIFPLLILLSFSAFAEEKFCPHKFEVLERSKGEGYDFSEKVLDKLYCTNKFEGESFKIVSATDEEAISFDNPNADLVKKAANVYYHLTEAKNFWLNEIKSDYVAQLPQITVRLDITNAFSNVRHFKNKELEKNYNNAWSIPEGKMAKATNGEQKSWGKEIWYSPMKKIETSELVKSTGDNPIHESLLLVKDPVLETTKNTIIYGTLANLTAPTINSSALLDIALKQLGTVAVLYGLIEVTKYMDKWFMNKYYFIDTAMIPEISYHEFSHIAMSDTLKTVHSVPVIEGMADYFAARIANRRQMYEKLEDYSSNKSKDIKSKMFYSPYLEGSWNSESDFTLSLLWLGKEDFDKLNAERAKKGQDAIANYDDLVFLAHQHLDETSEIATGLTKALIDACKSKCQSLRPGVNTLQGVFEKKGLN
ncbi:MAG: hypothetical protein ACXVLQ_04230 [Bacteriovorax sp.]